PACPPPPPSAASSALRGRTSQRRLPPAAPGDDHLPERARGRVGVHLPRRGPAHPGLRHHLHPPRPPPRHPVPVPGRPLGRLPGRGPGLPGRLPPPKLTRRHMALRGPAGLVSVAVLAGERRRGPFVTVGTVSG